MIADPEKRFVDVYDSVDHFERVAASVELYSPAIMPDLRLPVRVMFAKLDLRAIAE